MHPDRYARRQSGRGFTLVELMVVISIIGILAAVALPRLIEVQRDARITKANAVFGLVRSAAMLAHSRCQLDLSHLAPSQTATDCNSNPPEVNMDGVMVRISNRYPAATAAGIDTAAAFNSLADGLVIGSTNQGGVPVRTFDLIGGTVPLCRVSYQEAKRNGNINVAPVIDIVTSGC